ncbi:MAG: phenylalanine--tRNA ligase subunit beta [Rickettsiales bacterium]|nr:phenylalanine--tRNA ligase subunit beta [Rickettsiales bacterium]
MKFTLGWLKDYLEFDSSIDELCERLTSIGLEVESFSDPKKKFEGFVVAKINDIFPHPDADKLRICEVFDGKKKLNIVCGAKNAKKNLISVLAYEGTIIKPGHKNQFTIKKSKIRGVESFGMLCSEEELGLSESSDGIMELTKKYEVGKNFSDYVSDDQTFIEISITPNRVDCASVYGIARDLSASGFGNLRKKKIPKIDSSFNTQIKLNNELKSSDCPTFLLRLIRGVKNSQSPDKIIKRFNCSDLKVISSLVDITNYITVDYCRPLHVFDYDKINGEITIRHSKRGEKFLGLDDFEYTLDDGMVVICDESKIISLAGILGGKETACGEDTKNVLLESAYFLPDAISYTGRKLNIVSDARYRFERGIDPESTLPGMEMATEMIMELCGGDVGTVISDSMNIEKRNQIKITKSFFKDVLGISISDDFITQKLEAIGCDLKKEKDFFLVNPPSWRPDLKIKEDLVEEVARLYGYENIPSIEMPISNNNNSKTNYIQKIRKKIKTLLVSRNISEIISWSFSNESIENLLSDDKKTINIQNPISSDLTCLRSNLIGNLLLAIRKNNNKNINNISLFELGPVFKGIEPGKQEEFISVVRSGNFYEKNWLEKDKSYDLFDIKADLNCMLKILGFDIEKFDLDRKSKSFYHPGKSGSLKIGGEIIAFFGEIHPEVLENLSIKTKTVAFEVNLTKILKFFREKNTSKNEIKVSSFQSSTRDFSFEIEKDTFSGDLVSTIRKIDKDLIKSVTIFDSYFGEKIKSSHKAIALEVKIQSDHKTLQDQEINDLSEKIIKEVKEKFDAKLR